MYLLNEAMRCKDHRLYRQSYVIGDGKVVYVRERMLYWKKQKVCMNKIVIVPARVGSCSSILTLQTKQERDQIEQGWLRQGITTIAVVKEVRSERTLINDLKVAQQKMKGITLDYLLGISVPIKRLTPSFIQCCRRLQIPFIQVDITSDDELMTVQWTRLAEALVTYPIVLQPIFHDKEELRLSQSWKQYCELYGLSTAQPMIRWSKELMQKSGIYPQKGELIVGSDADYLLFQQSKAYHISRQARKLATSTKLDYDKVEPAIVVRRGRILKANETFDLQGDGMRLIVKKPKRLFSMEYVT